MTATASALRIIDEPVEKDTSTVPARACLPVAHLPTALIVETLQAAHGVMADAARRLGIGRNTLYERCRADPKVDAARAEVRAVFVDLAESELHKLVAAGNPSAVFFTLRTLGARRGWREGLVVEQTPEGPRKRDMTAALRALTPEELLQLEALLGKVENAASDATRASALDEIEGEIEDDAEDVAIRRARWRSLRRTGDAATTGQATTDADHDLNRRHTPDLG